MDETTIVELVLVHEGEERVEDCRRGIEYLVEKHNFGTLHLPFGNSLELGIGPAQLGKVEIAKEFGRFGKLSQEIFEVALVLFLNGARMRLVTWLGAVAWILIKHADMVTKRPDQARLGGAGRADHYHRLSRDRRADHAAHRFAHVEEAAVQNLFELEHFLDCRTVNAVDAVNRVSIKHQAS